MNALHWAVLALLLLAGCLEEEPVAQAAVDPPEPEAAMAIAGLVQSINARAEFRPVADAEVRVRGTDLNTTTDPEGRFAFDGLEPAVYLIDVAAADHGNATYRVGPAEGTVTLDVQLQRLQAQPHRQSTHFQGHLQCAAEYLIISGPCDAVVTSDQTLGMDPVFAENSTFELEVEQDWRTVVVDVVFAPEDHPGVDGLRTVVRGLRDADAAAEYEQYARFHGQESHTFRLEPGAEHEEGVVPIPVNATTFRFQVLPHSHGWHAVCDPEGETCLLGAGVATDLEFDLYATVFYGEPAPEGFTLRT